MSNIITFTTDFGLQDYFVGVMKGVILSINPGAHLIDLNNNIKKHDIMNAGISVMNSYRYFPEGSVHLVVVDPGVGSKRKPVGVYADGHYFIGPDNGIFTFLYEGTDDLKIHEITNTSCMLKEISSTFHGRDIFAPSAAFLSLKKDITLLGEQLYDPVKIPYEHPVVTDNKIIGKVVYVDTFGNLITNIKSDIISSNDHIIISGLEFEGVSESYSEAEKGEPMVVRGSSGYIEIAVNLDSASEYFRETDLTVEVVKN